MISAGSRSLRVSHTVLGVLIASWFEPGPQEGSVSSTLCKKYSQRVHVLLFGLRLP